MALLSPERESYEAWLRERGVWWDPRIRLVAPSEADAAAIAHGWGVIASGAIERGEILFSIPKAACFGARCGRAHGVRAEEVDSQAELVAQMLHERALGSSSRWCPLLSTLPADVPCPWRWTAEEREWLRGTELERPLAAKAARLEREYAHASQTGAFRGASFDEWSACCAVAISHVNPWWGGCIAPFACMLNAPDARAGERPGVAYELAPDESALVGVALARLRPGQEVTQSYGEEQLSVADLVYRYGFSFPEPPRPAAQRAPPRSDVVSVRAEDLRDVARAIASGSWLHATSGAGAKRPRARAAGAASGAWPPASSAAIEGSLLAATRALGDTFDARIALLRRACVLQPCPWDGLEHLVTLELRLADDWQPPCAQGARARWRQGARWPAAPPGLHELLIACEVLFGLSGSEWQRLSGHVAARAAQQAHGRARLDEDDRTALALAAALGALRAGEWPPSERREAHLLSRLRLARAIGARAQEGEREGNGEEDEEDGEEDGEEGEGEGSSDEEDEEGSEDEEDDDAPLWEALAPAEPSTSPDIAFASPLAVRAAQGLIDWMRLRKFRAVPRVGGSSDTRAAEMAEALHAVEISVLHGCALVLDFHAHRLAGDAPELPQRGAHPEAAGDSEWCAAWRRLRATAARGCA